MESENTPPRPAGEDRREGVRVTLTLRPFTATDYDAYAALHARADPDDQRRLTADALRHRDGAAGDGELWGRLMAERGARLVGAGGYRSAHSGGERQFALTLLVDPGEPVEPVAERLFPALLERIAAATAPLTPNGLRATVREDRRAWLAFYRRHGFVEIDREWTSVLALDAFDPTPFGDVRARLDAAGVRLDRLSSFAAGDDVVRRFYTLMVALLADVPHSEPLQIWPFEVWKERFWRSPVNQPAHTFLALAGEEFVGVTMLRDADEPTTMKTGLTGVLPAFRRRGIALALKLAALEHARRLGARRVSTQNHAVNRPMLAINEALGFVKDPAWITLRKDLSARSEETP